MTELLLMVMFVAAVLYAVLAGADFGAGLIEGFVDEQGRKKVDIALAPVWEANHVWLVLLVVVAFVGFPTLYTVLSTALHIPLLIVLVGIVARGAAFTFRHYDPVRGPATVWYTWLFRLGSFATPLFLGIIVAASAEGNLSTTPQGSFYDAFVGTWNTPFCWLTGLFVCGLFAFEGAALLAAENARGQGPLPYLKLARITHGLTIVAGALVLLVAWLEGSAWLTNMLSRPLALTALALATLLIPLVARAFALGKPWLLRIAMGAQAALVLLGFGAAQYPVLLQASPRDLIAHEVVAPPATQATLLISLAVGLALILPTMAYLVRVYKR